MIISDKTLSFFLEEMIPHLKTCVGDEDALFSLKVIQHPALLPLRTSTLFIETPLDERKKWVDLSIKVDPYSPHFADSLACLLNAFSTSQWRLSVQELSSFKLKAGAFWIELDIGSSLSELLPNLFISTQEFQGDSFVESASQLFSNLYGVKPSRKMQDRLNRYATTSVKREDKIFSFAIMLARKKEAVRIHSYCNLAASSLEERLRESGYLYNAKELSSFLSKVPPLYLKKIGLALDIGDEVFPTVGIELFNTEECERGTWEPLLDILVREGLASSHMAQKSLFWNGDMRKLEGENYSIFMRKINHIKITFNPLRDLSAKIYLRAVHRLLPCFRDHP